MDSMKGTVMTNCPGNSTNLKIPWRRARQPTLVFLPGDSPWTEEPGGLWGHKE